ncbi:MAG TPA: trypsin-like peptidase domain-containing protein [Thermoanaerobaculia bacterium]
MTKLRTILILFALGLGCKPAAESQPIQTEPLKRGGTIPPTVSASRRTPVVTVAHNVLPAVVNIETEATIRRRTSDPFFDPFGFFGGGRERNYTSQSLGSGFVWSAKEGIVVTNNHVVEGASRINVNFNDGRRMSATLIGVDPDSDLAVLRVEAKDLVAAPIGSSGDLLIGETVVAVGNPFGLSGTVTTGVVSAVGRSVPSQENDRIFTDFIQTDASINPGNSGGPLLNIEGKVVGINVAIYAQGQGIGFAIPVDRAKKIVDDLLRYGEVHSAWIGAVTATLTPEEARRLDLRATRGALVARVFSGSPAAEAGLRPNDVIVSVDGKPVESREQFSTLTATLTTSRPVALTVLRGGAQQNIQLRPTDPPANLGLRVLEQVAGLRVTNEGQAVIVDAVTTNSRAQRIGIEPGDYVVGVNGAKVTSTEELNRELMRGAERSSVVLSVARGRYVYNLTFPMGM